MRPGDATSAGAATLRKGEEPAFARALARARRHSRHVRWMRAGLPVLAVVVTVGFLGAAWVANAVPDGFSLDAFKVEDGELVMTNPRLVGFDERDQPYSVDAERATQNVANPDRFQLHEVLAEIPMADGRRVTVLSGGGAYDRKAEVLTIPTPFTITVDDGTVAQFAGGTVDVAAGTFVSSGAVDMDRPEGRIVADGLRIERAGQSALFTGNVRVTIEPGSPMAPPTMRGAAAPTDAPATEGGAAAGLRGTAAIADETDAVAPAPAPTQP